MKNLIITAAALLLTSHALASLKIREIRTAADNVIELFYTSDTLDVNEVDISDPAQWKVNGAQVLGINRTAAAADMCDHFVYPEYRLGNIRQQTLTGLMYSDRQRNFGKLKTGTLTRQCRECRFLFACHGECPKNRFVRDVYGELGHNYLCAGYRKFFEHVAADMDFMKAELDAQRPPSNIMLKNR